MSRLETSTRIISIILAHLLETGISENWLNDTDLDVSSEDRKHVRACMDWLVSEGLVRYASDAHTDNEATWINPTLTSRGFACLGTRIEFEGDQLTVAEIVERKGEISGGYSSIGDFLGGALGGFIKSLGS